MRRSIPAAIALLLLLFAAPGLWAQETSAQCTLAFNAIWSAATHPTGFPPNPHFSPLIGATHHNGVRFWAPGGTATAGIEAMAEIGATGPLTTEVNTAIGDGTANAVISGGGIAVSPGAAFASFTLHLSHPRITAVSMIAPSPDWFVGIHGLSMFRNGHWLAEQVVDLPAYDAGTDSGLTFTAPDSSTIPQGVITQITGPPFLGGTSMGTFTLRCSSDLTFRDGFESGDLRSWAPELGSI